MAPKSLGSLEDRLNSDGGYEFTPKEVENKLDEFRRGHSSVAHSLQERLAACINTRASTNLSDPSKMDRMIALIRAAQKLHQSSSNFKARTQQGRDDQARELSDGETFGNHTRHKVDLNSLQVPAANMSTLWRRGPQSRGQQQANTARRNSAGNPAGNASIDRNATNTAYRPSTQPVSWESTPKPPVSRESTPKPQGFMRNRPRSSKSPESFYTSSREGSQGPSRKPKDDDPEYKHPKRQPMTRSAAPSRLGLRTRQKAKGNQEPIEIISSDEETEKVDPPKQDGQSAHPDDVSGVRRSTRNNAWQSTTAKYEGLKALFPPCGGKASVQILASDLSRLDPTEFLNDTVMDFYMRWIQEHLGSENKENFHFFNSFFFPKLTEKSGDCLMGKDAPSKRKVNHERVRKWTKGVDIFKKEFLFVPIHDQLHWSLVIICFPANCVVGGAESQSACMLHLDSMDSGHNQQTVCSALRGYLAEEWESKMQEEGTVANEWRKAYPDAVLPDFSAKSFPAKKPSHIPRQDNYWDCGLFVLTYIHYWSFMPPEAISAETVSTVGENDDAFPLILTKHWFSKDNAGLLRNHLRELILTLFIEQSKDKDSKAILAAISERDDLAKENSRYRSPEAALSDNARLRESLKQEKEDKKRKAEAAKREKEAQALAKQKEEEERRRRLSPSVDIEVDLGSQQVSHVPDTDDDDNEGFSVEPGADARRSQPQRGDDTKLPKELRDIFSLIKVRSSGRVEFVAQYLRQQEWLDKQGQRSFRTSKAAIEWMWSEVNSEEPSKKVSKRPNTMAGSDAAAKRPKNNATMSPGQSRQELDAAHPNGLNDLASYSSDDSPEQLGKPKTGDDPEVIVGEETVPTGKVVEPKAVLQPQNSNPLGNGQPVQQTSSGSGGIQRLPKLKELGRGGLTSASSGNLRSLHERISDDYRQGNASILSPRNSQPPAALLKRAMDGINSQIQQRKDTMVGFIKETLGTKHSSQIDDRSPKPVRQSLGAQPVEAAQGERHTWQISQSPAPDFVPLEVEPIASSNLEPEPAAKQGADGMKIFSRVKHRPDGSSNGQPTVSAKPGVTAERSKTLKSESSHALPFKASMQKFCRDFERHSSNNLDKCKDKPHQVANEGAIYISDSNEGEQDDDVMSENVDAIPPDIKASAKEFEQLHMESDSTDYMEVEDGHEQHQEKSKTQSGNMSSAQKNRDRQKRVKAAKKRDRKGRHRQ